MRILVADDSRSARAMMKALVSRAGHEVLEAEDGEGALAALRRYPHPAIAVLDWQMPKLDGIDVCRTVRAEDHSGLPYVVMVTARSDRDSLTAAFDAGADDFVSKPYNAEELLARVRAGVRIVELNRRNRTFAIRLQHREKLESVGRMAAGVAHEINTPCQYIGDNLRFLSNAFSEISRIVGLCDELKAAVESPERAADLLKKATDLREKIDLDYLFEEVPCAVKQGIEGIDTVSKIVGALKEFAVVGDAKKSPTDIGHLISTTAEVAKGEWKSVATVTIRIPDDFPPVVCNAADIRQVFIALLLRAAAAVGQKKQASGAGRIDISAGIEGDFAEFRVEDSGLPISAAAKEAIFDPLYTAKESEPSEIRGTAAAYDIVVNGHGGGLRYISQEQNGTVFIVRLPLRG